MKIGIELRPVVPGESGGIALLLVGVLGTLFARHPEQQFLVFCTVFNRHLLTAVPAHVTVRSLPCRDFNAELDRLLRREHVEVLFRCYPQEALDFPCLRQVVFIPDMQHEVHPESFTPEVLRDRRRYFNRDLSRAGAIGTLTEHARRAMLEHEWTRCRNIFLMSPASDSLLAACRRVAARAAADGAPPVSVSSMPLVSIVTPSYNQGGFIKQTIDSVLGQSYPHVEYIVIDGNSADETVSVLKSYGPRLSWISEPDGGQTDALNKGFARSKGEVRAYVNSDDLLLPGAVEKAVEHFRRQPDADMVYGQGVLIDKAGRRIGMYRTDDYSFARLMLDCCICQPAAFWLTRIAEKVGPFDERLDYAMDYDYWLRIDRAGGRIDHLREPLAASRRYPKTKTSTARAMIYDEIFRVSSRHEGYVSVGWCIGLWDYLLCERDRWHLGRLLHRTGLCVLAGRLHYFRSTRNPYDMMQTLQRFEQRLTSGKVSLLEPSWAAFKLARSFVRHLGDRERPVCGFWSDNWLGPECTVRLAPNKSGRTRRLAGTSPVENSLSISAGGEELGNYSCPANRRVEISFTVPETRASKLVLHFSEHVRDADRRRLSFLLDATDLFDEQHSSPSIKAPRRSTHGESL